MAKVAGCHLLPCFEQYGQRADTRPARPWGDEPGWRVGGEGNGVRPAAMSPFRPHALEAELVPYVRYVAEHTHMLSRREDRLNVVRRSGLRGPGQRGAGRRASFETGSLRPVAP